MDAPEVKEPIKIYLDDQEEPFKVEQPPLRFNFNTIHLPDGDHTLRIEASNGLAPPTIKKIPFTVRNGVALTVSGLEQGQTIGGQVELIINAYAGNTEVDFEPRRAETPEPIPTWAWVLFLTIFAWTMFYLLNPAQAYEELLEERRPEAEVGEQLYMDTCARCHGETGDGQWIPSGPEPEDGYHRIPRLRDNPENALADTPFPLMQVIVLGKKNDGVPMPEWGPILSNEEIVAIVNHVRTTWRHDATKIELEHRRPPAEIEELEKDLAEALEAKDADALGQCCWPTKSFPPPILYRTDDTYARGHKKVAEAWKTYFTDLGPNGKVLQFKLTEKRYDYEPATVDQIGSLVIGMGRIFLQAQGEDGSKVSEQGRFIRVYKLNKGGDDPEDPPYWSLIFDFADIPMRIGCDVGYCPPDQLPGATNGSTNGGAQLPDLPDLAPTGDNTIGYADVQAMIRATGKSAGDAPHETFWDLPWKEFCAFEFEESWDEDDKLENKIRLVVPGDVAKSNLIRALEGRPVLVLLPSGEVIERASIARMPKNGPFLSDEDMAKLKAWVAAGCPETPGGPPYKEEGAEAAPVKEPVKDEPKDPVGGGETFDGAVGFDDVKQLIKGLGKGAGDAPHESFWNLSWDAFCRFEFEESWEEEDKLENKIVLVRPGDPDRSNLLRAMAGEPILVTLPDGSEIERKTIARMPKNGPFLDAEGLAKVRKWIADGCPEKPGGPPHELAGAAKKAPDEPKAPDEGAAPPPAPVASVGFEEIKQMLRALGKTPSTVPHGAFWEELSYAQFVAFTFPRNYGDELEYRLLIPYDAKNSNLVKVLVDGKGVVREGPDGKRVVEDVTRMPKNAPPMPKAALEKLIEWIDAGCPEKAGEPSKLPRAGDPMAPKADEPGSFVPEGPAPGGGFPDPDK
ncbi:MAG: c-type cytochrome [Planctomycetota bacterium]|nr:c-type cytochrome [Planctomycetota bacterium]